MNDSIYTRIIVWLAARPTQWFTRKQVGEGIGLKKTPYLAEALDRLSEEGTVERQLGQWGGFACWFYRAPIDYGNQLPLWGNDGVDGAEVVNDG